MYTDIYRLIGLSLVLYFFFSPVLSAALSVILTATFTKFKGMFCKVSKTKCEPFAFSLHLLFCKCSEEGTTGRSSQKCASQNLNVEGIEYVLTRSSLV